MKRSVFISTTIAAVAVATLALAGCSTTASGAGTASSDPASGPIRVVASTNVWGDIAEQIGGDDVSVTSIIDDPNKDPHEYQASGQNQLALSKAEIVVVNGGGYDDFVGDMLKAVPTKPVVLTAADISGYDQHPSDGDFNEHLWYDFPTVDKVAQKLVAAYSKARPKDAGTFESNAKKFEASVAQLTDLEAQLKQSYAGKGAAITEPVPLYMLNAIGLVDKTPEKFSEAIENDSDVAPAVLRETLALFSGHKVALLAYNEQTTGAETQQVLDAAKANDVPVVPVTETLPEGKTYLTWMRSNLDNIGAALKKSR
ncbi:metal ABC transporter solute-binding protein, Zn/Mn family [Humibacter ginsenosidimutans]|uniref:ABC transporter substrate-binding protein n=1 Tax=Humibacter ginsenosidimutans TaxID=2599293 RepID=A0A5B8M6S5_9MICO|nr:zinc ABC transporter substrate-binding protein [Humibacter ginsenosidimutans]QDZ15415.1 ABC transporter substrate-binding protein [Humibacter ginsenosidimutans]